MNAITPDILSDHLRQLHAAREIILFHASRCDSSGIGLQAAIYRHAADNLKYVVESLTGVDGLLYEPVSIRSREPVDREAAKRDAILKRRQVNAALEAVTTRTPVMGSADSLLAPPCSSPAEASVLLDGGTRRVNAAAGGGEAT